ncbi:hypothetical protein GW933_02225 [Candidatus Falkowbacteria bacterium]|uniref:Uncharacterized protein n=1 Tax=Candidatus Buchananbacteria bacterium CG10_big_fil_rev_8_21_14_0_10_33_19 TaxID=1974525 RepID=A0A2H0W3X2_9BACT|nr:hypothetical protein [Candidatus Falkowbacteria bacterium]PIS06063.1 MAG: hypothetical protein COT80_04850 [Candidatus Buchananbacteria bacterium CG10_big_fil_rev_8_21_14_0_10_33_19]
MVEENPTRPGDILRKSINTKTSEKTSGSDLGLEKAVDLIEELAEKPMSALEKMQELLGEVDKEYSQEADSVTSLVESSEQLVDEQLTEADLGMETEPIKSELAEAENDLLGRTSDAADEFKERVEEILSDSDRLVALRKKWNYQKTQPLEWITGLSDVEQGLRSAREITLNQKSDNNLDLDSKLSVEKQPDDWADILDEVPTEATTFVNPEIDSIESGSIDFGLFEEADTSVVLENPRENDEKVDVPLRTKKNVGVFTKMSQEARQVFADLTFKYRGQQEINKGQKLIERSSDKIHNLNKDLLKSEDNIEELKDKLLNIEEMSGKMTGELKPRELKAIEKSRKDLETKIQTAEKAKIKLAEKLKIEDTGRAELEVGLVANMVKLEQAIDSKLEPYQTEMSKLESSRLDLVAEKDNFEVVADEFSGRLLNLKNRILELDEVTMPTQAKKSFKAVLKRKVDDIEAALKVSQKNIDKLEDNIIKINGRINKEESRIEKWQNIRGDLQEAAKKREEKEREVISPGYIPQIRSRESEGSARETPVFSAKAYVDKWNSFSKNDGMLLMPEQILAKHGDLNIKRLESIVKTTRFKGLNERQLKNKTTEKINLLRAYFGIH